MKYVSSSAITLALALVATPAFSASQDEQECVVDITFGMKTLATNVATFTPNQESRIFPLYSGHCSGSAGAGIAGSTSERRYYLDPLVRAANLGARDTSARIASANLYFDKLVLNGNATVVVSTRLNGVKKAVKTHYYTCTDTTCTNVARPVCGLYRGGTTDDRMIASPNPAASVAATDAACNAYCDSSNPSAGDMCIRGAAILRKF